MQSNKLYFGGKEESCHPALSKCSHLDMCCLPAYYQPARPAAPLAGCCAKRLTQSRASRACPRFVDYAICYHYYTTILQPTVYCRLLEYVCTWPMLLEPNLSLRTLNPRALIRRLQKLPKAAASKVRPCRAAPWARAIKNVKEPLGERGRKSKHLFGPQVTFLIL